MKRKPSQNKVVDAYDFNEEDARVEIDSKTSMKKFEKSVANYRKASKDISPVDKYTFLHYFTRGSNCSQVGASEAPIIEVDSSNSGKKGNRKRSDGDKEERKSLSDSHNVVSRGSNYGTSEAIIEVDSIHSGDKVRRKSNSGGKQGIKSLYDRAALIEDGVTKEMSHVLDDILISDTSSSEQIVLSNSDNDDSGGVTSCQVENSSLGVPLAEKIHTTSPDLPFDNHSLDVMSDDECVKQSSPQFHSSVIRESEGYSEDSASEHNSSEWHFDNKTIPDKGNVVVFPCFLQYKDKHGKRNCSDSFVTFSRSCIKLKCTNSYGKRESFSSEWAISQVSTVESQWISSVSTARVKICIRPISQEEVEGVNDDPGLVELQLAVYDPNWSETQESINSLDARYRALWKLVLDNDTSEVGFSEENSSSYSKHYSPNGEHFESVIYPQSDPDSVIITSRDIELLQPERFLNDTIIDFYIKYLKNKIPPEDGHRFHFFNSFFFRKLADLDRNLPSAFQGSEAFQRVRKWTRKVNLFEKDYVFVPINFHHHWSLIIICHPGEVAKSRGEEVDKSIKVPCILHMNSIEGSHRGLVKVIQSYLWEEWKERTPGASEDYLSKFRNLRFVNLEVPQQDNSYDCGLFLLHYVERFLQEAPFSFSPFNIAKESDFLTVNWFLPAEASQKRLVICDLLHELAEGNTDDDFGEESGLPSVSEAGTSGRICHADSSFSVARLRIENGLHKPNAESFTKSEHQTDSFQQLNGTASLLQENDKNGKQFQNAPPGEIDSQPHEIALYNEVGVSVEQGEHRNEGYNVGTSGLGPHAEIELGTGLHHLPANYSKDLEETERLRSVSPEDVMHIEESPASTSSHERPEDCIVEDSEEVVGEVNVRCILKSPASSHERPEDRIVEDSEEVVGEVNVRCILRSPASSHERLDGRIVEDSQEVMEKLRSVSREDVRFIEGSSAPASSQERLENLIAEDSQEGVY